MQKVKHGYFLSLVEVCICLAILGLLMSTTSYLAYAAISEFRVKNGRTKFINDIRLLNSQNALHENALSLHIKQNKNYIETELTGNLNNIKSKTKRYYYVGKLFNEGEKIYLPITPQLVPSYEPINKWIEQASASHK